MALIKCPECGKQISNKAEVCPHCGINLKEKKILHKDPEEIKEAVEVTDTSSKYDSENNVIDNTANGDIKSKDTNIEVKNKSKNRSKICIEVLSTVCVLSLIGNAVQFSQLQSLLHKNTENLSEPSENNVVTPSQNETNSRADSVIADNTTQEEDTTANGEIPEDADLTIPFLPDNLFSNYKGGATYRCGTDLEPGKYIIYGYLGYGYYEKYSELAKKEEAEYIEGIFISVELKEGEYIDVGSSCIIISESEFDTNNLTQYGIYEVGKDIEPGEYRVVGMSNEYRSQYGSWDGSFGGIEISDAQLGGNIIDYQSSIGTDQKYISLQDGQYLRGVDVALYKVN